MITTVKDFLSQRFLILPTTDTREDQRMTTSTFTVKSKNSLSLCMCEAWVYLQHWGKNDTPFLSTHHCLILERTTVVVQRAAKTKLHRLGS